MAFGFIGLFIGPTLLAAGYCLVREFTAEKVAKQAAASTVEAQRQP